MGEVRVGPSRFEWPSTERLRRLLEGRGVEYTADDGEHVKETCWPYMGELMAVFAEYDNGTTRFACDTWCFTPEQAIAATVGRSCASCPEMDNPDSYISHLQSALKWHDEHVPRPTNPRNTCVVLEGEKVPEEVLFIGANGVTHYLPEEAGTCKDVCASVSEFTCSECGFNCDLTSWISLFDGDDGRHRHHHHGTPKFCPECGAKVVAE